MPASDASRDEELVPLKVFTPDHNTSAGAVSFGGNPMESLSNLASIVTAPLERSGNNEFLFGKKPTRSSTIDFQSEWAPAVVNKDVAIDGTPLTLQEKGPNWWEHKYKKELAVASVLYEQKHRKQMEDLGTSYNETKWFRKIFGAEKKRMTAEELSEAYDRERQKAEEEYQKNQSMDDVPEGFISNRKSDRLSWDEIIQSLEEGRPVGEIVANYHRRRDFYGIDSFLDSSPSFMWLGCKTGALIGTFLGGSRAAKVSATDGQFVKASGLGILTLTNLTILGTTAKWAGQGTLLALTFIVGDRLATMAKTMTMPSYEAKQRSPGNYAAGLAVSFASIGVLPWWVMNDVGLSMRFFGQGIVLGGLVGYWAGTMMNRLTAATVQRLDASPKQIRRYEATMSRQRGIVEEEQRRRASHDFSQIFSS